MNYYSKSGAGLFDFLGMQANATGLPYAGVNQAAQTQSALYQWDRFRNVDPIAQQMALQAEYRRAMRDEKVKKLADHFQARGVCEKTAWEWAEAETE